MQRFLTWLMILSTLMLAACQQSVDPGDQVLARLGEETITVAQFEQEMARRSESRPMFFQRASNRRALLEELIRHRMLVQEARDAGIDQEPQFRALVERMLIQRLREKRLEDELETEPPTDAEIAAYYENSRAAFSRPTRRQIAMIRLEVPASADDSERRARRDQAEAARQAAVELPADITHFDAVAVEFSDDRSSRYQGGVVGWLIEEQAQRYRWPGPVLEAAFSLEKVGQMSALIETPDAFYLLRLADMQPGRVQPLEQVADGIRHRLRRERARVLEQELFADIAARHSTEIDEAVLESIEPPPGIPAEPGSRPAPPALPNDPAAPAAVNMP